MCVPKGDGVQGRSYKFLRGVVNENDLQTVVKKSTSKWKKKKNHQLFIPRKTPKTLTVNLRGGGGGGAKMETTHRIPPFPGSARGV